MCQCYENFIIILSTKKSVVQGNEFNVPGTTSLRYGVVIPIVITTPPLRLPATADITIFREMCRHSENHTKLSTE